jgi:hypothetical protein
MAFASPPCHKQIEVSSMLIFKTGLPSGARVQHKFHHRQAANASVCALCRSKNELDLVAPGELETVSPLLFSIQRARIGLAWRARIGLAF